MSAIHIVLVTYALDVTPLVDSLWTSDVTLHLYTHSKIPMVVEACREIESEYPNVRWNNYGINRGLARSWNDGMLAAQNDNAEVIILLNDDITASKADMYQLTEAAVKHRECGVVQVRAYNEITDKRILMGYGFTAIQPIALETVGAFDVNYWPIYGEDVDYSRRCGLLGVTFYDAGESGVVHEGSTTIKAVPELAASHQKTFRDNHLYHVAKHGGFYGQETFDRPFNDPTLDWYIPLDNYRRAYPDRARDDIPTEAYSQL